MLARNVTYPTARTALSFGITGSQDAAARAGHGSLTVRSAL
jgi:hypothetical protein